MTIGHIYAMSHHLDGAQCDDVRLAGFELSVTTYIPTWCNQSQYIRKKSGLIKKKQKKA